MSMWKGRESQLLKYPKIEALVGLNLFPISRKCLYTL